jgi:DNA-nicking Smr family endonuclease
MSKKKKPQPPRPQPKAADPDAKLAHNPFADKLRDRQREHRAALRQEAERAAQETRRREAAAAAAAAQERTFLAEARWRRGESVQMTDEELFQAALEGLDPVRIERGKYSGAGPVTAHIQARPPQAEEKPYEREARIFSMEFDFSEVERIESNRYLPEPPTRAELDQLYRFAQRDHKQAPTDSREALVEAVVGHNAPPLRAEQKRLLEDARAASREGRLRELNLRLHDRDTALQRIEAQAHRAVEDGLRYLRVITGKGLQSQGEPVLKRALAEWCVAKEVEFTPEPLPDGTFGSFLLRLPRGAQG